MVQVTINNNQAPSDGLITDPETIVLKQNLMARDKRSNFLNGISDTAKFLAGILLASGMAIIGTAMKVAVGAAGPTFPAVLAAFSNPVGLSFLAVAAVATITAVAANYYGSHIYQSAGFDITDFNAKATAKNLVNALKENNMCMTTEHEHEGNCRADGKQWAQVVRNDPAIARA